MIQRFREWRQNRRTDKMLARIQCLSGYHPEVPQGDMPGLCRCGYDVLGHVVAKALQR